MERTLKVKAKINRVPRSTLPSERRYSASMVIGLSIIFSVLFLFSIIMGNLILHKMTLQHLYNSTINQLQNISIFTKESNPERKVINEFFNSRFNITFLMCSVCYIMALGYFVSFIMGFLAYKRWYVDRYISYFFFSTIFSVFTSFLGIIVSFLAQFTFRFDYDSSISGKITPITFSSTINVVILSIVGFIWSVLSTKLAYVGMKSVYSDDIVFNIHTSIDQLGNIPNSIPNKNCQKKHDRILPKDESLLEFRQRVDSFLSESPQNT